MCTGSSNISIGFLMYINIGHHCACCLLVFFLQVAFGAAAAGAHHNRWCPTASPRLQALRPLVVARRAPSRGRPERREARRCDLCSRASGLYFALLYAFYSWSQFLSIIPFLFCLHCIHSYIALYFLVAQSIVEDLQDHVAAPCHSTHAIACSTLRFLRLHRFAAKLGFFFRFS